QPSDWIYWRTNTTYPQVDKSPIVIAMADASPKLFRCPLDTDDSARMSSPMTDEVNGPYLYSYSVTSYDVANGFNLGMSSVFTGGQNLPFRLAAIRNPGQKIMVAEEVASLGANDDASGSQHIINDGRWTPADADPLT